MEGVEAIRSTNLSAYISGDSYDSEILEKIVENIGIEKQGETNSKLLRSYGLIEE